MKKIYLLFVTSWMLYGFSPPPEPPSIEEDINSVMHHTEVQMIESLAQEIDVYLESRTQWKQERLQELGWYTGEVDGISGPLTQNAIQGAVEAAEIDSDTYALIEAIEAQDVPEAPVAISSTSGIATHWIRLAECESGNWINGGASFESGSARWNWGAPGMQVPSWGSSQFHGGLQFAPSTWSWVAPMVGLGHIQYAYQATPQEQVRVGQRVQELQSWSAWPVCSVKVGLR